MDQNKAAFNNPASVDVYSNAHLKPIERELIQRYFKGKVLDVGCGTGRTTINLHQMGYEVAGIDYAPKLIEQGKKLHPQLDLRVMDARELDFPDESFDTVFFSYNGLDYLYPEEARKRALNEFYRVLKTGGTLIYSTHKRAYLDWPFLRSWPFINIHYLRFLLTSLTRRGPYIQDKHPFGTCLTYCKNDCTQEGHQAGFTQVTRLPQKNSCYYICKKNP